MKRIARVGLLVLIALFGTRALAAGLQFHSRQVNISPPVTPEWLRRKIVLDTGVLSVADTAHVPIDLSTGTAYSWSVNVTSGRVAISLTEGGVTSWALNISSPGLWQSNETFTVSAFPPRVQSTGLSVLWFDRSGAVGFNWSPEMSGAYQVVIENLYSTPDGVQVYSSFVRVAVAPTIVLAGR